MDFNQYQVLAARTIGDLTPNEMLAHAKSGMVAEIGEFHAIYQKHYQGHDLDPEHLKKELGDLLWFMAEYCSAMQWDFEEIARMNIVKLKARYPEGFSAERSLHRAEGDI